MVTWIGADWDSDKCVVLYSDGHVCKRGKVKRHPRDVGRFVRQFDECVVGIESGDPLWAKLWRQTGAVVHVFDGKKARRFSESLCSSGARDDRRSAEDILHMVQSNAHRRSSNEEPGGVLAALHRLLRMQEDARKDVARYKNRLTSLLRQVHPEFACSLPDLDKKWVLRVLKAAPTPAAWNELSRDEKDAALKNSSTKARLQIEERLGEDWAVVEPAEEPVVRLQVRQLVSFLEQALEAKRQVKKQLEEAGREHNVVRLFRGVDGLGDLLATAAAVALQLPSPKGEHRDRVAVRLGSAPVTGRSGVMGDKSPHVSMRRGTSRTLRNAGHLLAAQLVRRHRWAKAQFAFYRSKGIGSSGAFRRVARSFSRILVAIERDQSQFDEQLYISKLKQNKVVWAMSL